MIPQRGWKWLGSRTSAALAAALVVLLLAGTTLLLSGEFGRSQALRAEVRTSFERRANLQTMLSLHQDVEIGQRGYVITGDRRFLQPYSAARSRIGQEMARLTDSFGDTGTYQFDLAMIRALSAEKLRNDDQSIALRAQGRTAQAVELIAHGRGKPVMDSLRRLLGRLDGLERRQIEERTSAARAATLMTQRLSATFEIGLILLLALASSILGRSLADRNRALRRVQEMNARQAAVFAGAKDGIIVLNASGSIESLNPAAARMYQYPPNELVRRDVGILFEVAPDQGKLETFLKRLQRRSGSGPENTHEFSGRRSDGTTFPVEVSLSLVGIPEGPLYVAIVRDISERKQIEQMKTEFVSTVSHELRTPLTSIAGSLGLLAGGAAGALPSPAMRLVTVARDNCQRLIRLINDILDIEKIESGKMRFHITPVPLAPLLEQAVESNAGFAHEHDVRLVLAPMDPRAVVMADADALTQVLTNLIANAVKFSPAGKVVRITLALVDRRYRISVADRGPGIPEEFRSRIFHKFEQADGTDTRGSFGTGLGLAIVHEIVTRLSGKVDFEDREGGGTTVLVDMHSAHAARLPGSSSGKADKGLPLVLHLDDDPDLVRLSAEAFSGRAQVRGVSTLAAARFFLSRHRPDAILIDLALADGSGCELLAELRDRGDRTPVVVFSAEDVDSRSALGADAFLVKSRASLDDLVATTMARIPYRKAAA
jgi:PAS domain S-box-containing protein